MVGRAWGCGRLVEFFRVCTTTCRCLCVAQPIRSDLNTTLGSRQSVVDAAMTLYNDRANEHYSEGT